MQVRADHGLQLRERGVVVGEVPVESGLDVAQAALRRDHIEEARFVRLVTCLAGLDGLPRSRQQLLAEERDVMVKRLGLFPRITD